MSSLQEVYVSVKGLIADNLSTMGVTGYSSSDGLTTLANAILEVEGGSDLTIALDLQSSSSSIQSGQTVNLTATLSATFNGETVDLNSVLQNAPITFKEGNTTINTVSTNANGVATISNYAPVGTGTVTLSAQFPTTDGFNGATDVITITVEDTPKTLTLNADKSILSYADSESAILTATYSGGTGATVQLYDDSDDSLIGTMTDNLDGTYSYTYNSAGVGDVSFYAKVGSLVSEIFALKDRTFYDASSSSNLSKYTIPTTNVTMTYDSTNNCYNCTVTTSATRTVILNNLTLSKHCKIQADINMINTSNTQPRIGLWNGNNGITSRAVISGTSKYFGISNQTKGNDGSNIEIHSGVNISTGNWYTLEVEYNNGTVTAKIYNGTTLIDTVTGSESTLASTGNDFGIDIGFGLNANFKIKNIMIQEL